MAFVLHTLNKLSISVGRDIALNCYAVGKTTVQLRMPWFRTNRKGQLGNLYTNLANFDLIVYVI